MKLIDSRGTPNGRRVKIFLAEKGLIDQLEYETIDIRSGDNLTDAFKAKNPMRKVPVLEFDDGSTLAESVAICRYFEAEHPEPALFGSTPREIGEIEQWNRWMELNFLMHVAHAFRHTTGLFKDREKVFPEWGEENKKGVAGAMKFMNKRLADSEFLAGTRFSVADITAYCTCEFAGAVGQKIPPEHEHLMRWFKQIRARPSVSTSR